jgi:dihydroxyacetone kinase-like predicted kinase
MADVIRAEPVRRVVVLPNARGLRDAVDEAAQRFRMAGRNVVVIPTRSPVQGLAALAVHDASARSDNDVMAMVAAAAATRYAEVVVATEAALTSAGPCVAGDMLGLIDDDVAVIGSDLQVIGCSLLDRMLAGGGELVTIVLGDRAPAGLADALVGHVGRRYPLVETMRVDGGAASTPLLIGVE